MESAVFYHLIEKGKKNIQNYERVYFGSEFCEKLLPSFKKLKSVMNYCLERDKKLTLLTPIVTNKGLKKLKKLLKKFYNVKESSWEVVVNDWGVLNWLQKMEYKGIAIGRLLTKQKRGPRIMRLKDKLSSKTLTHLKKFSLDNPILRELFDNVGVIRVELDNVLQGIESKTSFSKTLYYPYVYITTTRYCLLSKLGKREFKLRRIETCNKECKKFDFVLTHKNMPKKIYLKGNTQFYKNYELPEDLESLNIDRIVYQE